VHTVILLGACVFISAAWSNSPDYVLTINFARADAQLTRSGTSVLLLNARVALPAHTPILPAHAEVTAIVRNPWWYPTERTQREEHVPRAVSPGSRGNAMGKCKLTLRFLSGHMDETVRIHGTNKPASIGKHVSRGCIRMRNEDIIALADIIDGAHTHVRFITGP